MDFVTELSWFVLCFFEAVCGLRFFEDGLLSKAACCCSKETSPHACAALSFLAVDACM